MDTDAPIHNQIALNTYPPNGDEVLSKALTRWYESMETYASGVELFADASKDLAQLLEVSPSADIPPFGLEDACTFACMLRSYLASKFHYCDIVDNVLDKSFGYIDRLQVSSIFALSMQALSSAEHADCARIPYSSPRDSWPL